MILKPWHYIRFRSVKKLNKNNEKPKNDWLLVSQSDFCKALCIRSLLPTFMKMRLLCFSNFSRQVIILSFTPVLKPWTNFTLSPYMRILQRSISPWYCSFGEFVITINHQMSHRLDFMLMSPDLSVARLNKLIDWLEMFTPCLHCAQSFHCRCPVKCDQCHDPDRSLYKKLDIVNLALRSYKKNKEGVIAIVRYKYAIWRP